MEMQENLSLQSQAILTELQHALWAAYSVDDLPQNAEIDALMEQLYRIPYARDVALDISNERLTRLLGNTANQHAQ
jgi:hypothetical protein